MRTKLKSYSRWLVVVVFAIAMAWVESAVVYYLRTMIDRIEPYQAQPLPLIGGLGRAELVREGATLIMLLTVGILAGRTWRSRLGYTAIAFGVWDIFYYIFLKVLCGWPHSLWDWDILFLLPLPWWGPVLAPVSIALLMVLWGTLVSTWPTGESRSSEWKPWSLNFIGVGLALYLFMADSMRVAGDGVNALRNMLPASFNWPLFCLALLLMAAPIIQVLIRSCSRPRRRLYELDHHRWINYFKRNRENRPEPDWRTPPSLQPEILAPLLRSLEQFQLGDGGGPASLIARDAERFRGSSEHMRTLVDYWFAEEQEHSRLLRCAVESLKGKTISSHWSFTAFCACRRVLGVRFELQVLLLTEITSTAYYRLLQRHTPIPSIGSMCALILRDEAGHIAFHRDRLAAQGRSNKTLSARLWLVQFVLCGYAAATMLWVNHRNCLCSLGGSTFEFYQEVQFELSRFLKALSLREKTVSPQESSGKVQPIIPLTSFPETVIQK
jgi:hypothetical protein